MVQEEHDVMYKVLARGQGEAADEDASVLRDYFNLQHPLAELAQEWADRDQRFRDVHPFFQG